MKSKLLALALALNLPAEAFAGEAGNILACIQAVEAFTGQVVDEFDVEYTGRILGMSTANWPGVECEPMLESVFNLSVNGKQYVVEGFAGMEAKRTFETLESETEDAVSLLNSRIRILERRLDEAEAQLKEPDLIISEIEDYVSVGIAKATGK
ncbi:hypothetical protein K3757_11425 [Sulfitobacter sp. S223]|uniref:hypothetical protein n=1 Tax=Sulfitobacter sp. S223 TaxID=2867023 RepID=UPI0021A885E5|nr:hypothetical protein [Sulfitobacter sp. S223]UWR25085.1 hypothetical protein K3757_11425 [Sulfitobacter sp. S223]